VVGSRAASFGMHAALALAALVVIFPVVWIGLAALKTQIALLRGDVFFTPVWITSALLAQLDYRDF
jgi:ABC-type glycerol-3-phosphate transport system permease component